MPKKCTGSNFIASCCKKTRYKKIYKSKKKLKYRSDHCREIRRIRSKRSVKKRCLIKSHPKTVIRLVINKMVTKNVKKIVKALPLKARCHHLRRITAKNDSIQMYGFDGTKARPIHVDSDGRIEVVTQGPIPSRVFHEQIFHNVPTENDWVPLPAQDTSTQITYSYAIVNRGDQPALVRLEIGPNTTDFAIDREGTAAADSTLIMAPTRFLHFTRIAVKAQNPGNFTELDIYFQAQSVG